METKTGYAVAVPAGEMLLYTIVPGKEQELHELLSTQEVRTGLIGACIEKENHRLLFLYTTGENQKTAADRFREMFHSEIIRKPYLCCPA